MIDEKVDVSYESFKAKVIASSAHKQNQNLSSVKKTSVKHINVEPVIFFYIIACGLASLTNQNLNIQKACRVNLRFNKSVCNELDLKNFDFAYFTGEEIRVQKLVADMLVWQTILQNSIPTIFVIFLGSWSDRNRRRRPCMLLPIFGEIIKNLGLMVCVYFFDQLPMEISGLWQSLPIALTGHWVVLFMSVYSYVGDISTVKEKTLKIGMVNLTVAFCLPIGSALSGILYRKFGYYGIYGTSSILCIISILLAFILVQDKNLAVVTDSSNSFWSHIKTFFNLKHVIKAFRVSFKKSKNHRRLKVIALIILITTIMGPQQGEKGVLYLFTRVKFNWNEMQFSIFSTFSVVINLIGTCLVLGVLIKKYDVSDALVGLIACLGKIISQVLFAYASSEEVFYLGAILNFLQGPAIISQKSIINKIIPADELGQVTAVSSIGENIIPIFCGPLYSAIYEITVGNFAGAFFLLTATITVFSTLIYIILYVLQRLEFKMNKKCVKSEGIGKIPNKLFKNSYGSITTSAELPKI
ncbi:uncharacterized protein LOC126896640 isoform X2 [Daktulosphaira vitifoliae]|uniref:uncharacterized protein LOC126896640 isoform X2 n=1 Tax=Daktulosphaira vitifoliae TaxID=58002 RepID=UPI0021AA7C16|nr:uncharacterized protein LOC126896640 isoform X2 [Daktulosphaira vitifoliae]